MDNRILRYKEQFGELKDGGIVWPQMATVFPVYGCNFHCVGCHYNAENEAGWKFLDVPVLLRRLAEMKKRGLRSVSLCGGGEPTLHPALEDLVLGVRGLGLSFGIITNGMRMVQNHEVRNLIIDNAAFVRISIWPETNMAGTRALSWHPRRGEMGIRCLVSKKNVEWYKEKIRFLRHGGWGYIDVKPERDTPDDPADLGDAWAEDTFAEFQELSPLVRGSLRKQSTKTKCYLTSVHAFIDAEGYFKLCCFFQHRKVAHTFGSIYELDQTFEELWVSKRHRDAQALIDPMDCNRWDCRFFQYLKIADAHLASEDVIPLIERDYFYHDNRFI